MAQIPWTEEQSQDVHAAPYLYPRLSNHALNLDYKRRSSDSNLSSSSKNLPSFSMMDTSGDESDSNHTADSIDTGITKMDWLESSTESLNFPHARMSQPQISTIAPWSTLNPGLLQSSSASSISTMPPAPAPQSGLAQMRAPVPSMTGASLAVPSNTASMMPKNAGRLALDTDVPMPTQPNGPTPKRLPQLTRLCTSNLNMSSGLQVPITPSRNLVSALSPGNFISAAITQDWSSWLDEPIVPSPMYEQGPCTGWNGLISATDASRTPTAKDVHMVSIKGTKNKQQNMHDDPKKSIEPSSPALISAIDWWRQNTESQWQFHKYTMAHFPESHTLRQDDPKSTLSFSVMSRFLAYCSFLCLREPSAPQPPFIHRNLLMTMKERLPGPLAVASSVLAALAMRLPTSEGWAWRLVGAELASVVETARGIMNNVHNSELGRSCFKSLEQQVSNFDDAWKLVGIIQALWCYTVVCVFEEIWNPSDPSSESSWPVVDRGWSPKLISETVDVLQAMVSILAQAGLYLQNCAWESGPKFLQQENDVKPCDFLRWNLCETIRRTVLATHALLILLRHLRVGWDKNGSTIILGCPPFPSLTYPVNWEPVMALKLPAVADIFDATNEATWRVRIENTSHSSNEILNLQMLMNSRPKFFEDRSSKMDPLVYSYFNEHDEFTNVCLSTIFGLSTSL